MNVKLVSLISLMIIFMGISAAILGGVVSDGAGATIITDGAGRTFEYTEPTEHIVTMGYASTLTAAMTGGIDKIIAVDTYSTYDYTKDDRLEALDAMNMGSIYGASNNDFIVSQFVQWVQDGKMSLHDTIILTSYSNAYVLRDKLNSVGFDHVLLFFVPPQDGSVLKVTYDQVVEFVNDISIIITGGKSDIADNMRLVENNIKEGLNGVSDKALGLGLWYYSTSGFSVCNTGSITASLIETAGGVNVAYNDSTSSTTYGDTSTIIQLVESNPNVVIFLPESYTRNNSVSDFRNNILGGDTSVTIVPMDANWNNYDPDAADGLWAFACAMYPNVFSGPAPHVNDGASGSDVLMYAVAGIFIALIMLASGYFVMRGP